MRCITAYNIRRFLDTVTYMGEAVMLSLIFQQGAQVFIQRVRKSAPPGSVTYHSAESAMSRSSFRSWASSIPVE